MTWVWCGGVRVVVWVVCGAMVCGWWCGWCVVVVCVCVWMCGVLYVWMCVVYVVCACVCVCETVEIR